MAYSNAGVKREKCGFLHFFAKGWKSPNSGV